MKEYNRIKAERKKNLKRKRKDIQGPGRPLKRQKAIESDEEEVYFDVVNLRENEDPYSILTEVTPWVLESRTEQGLEGMKEGFVINERNDLENKIAFKGEWKMRSDNFSS